jgi:2-methylisocitrate lyase-like PEP mutase family enzyme
MGATQRERAEAFAALHAGPAFVIPNPWDAGSARVLEELGFPALATTSSGLAYALGRGDGSVTLDEIAAHVALLTGACSLPVSVDLENGYGPGPADAATAIARVAEAGAVGGSIEDWDRDNERLYGVEEAVERLAAAVEAARALPFPFTLTARAENHIRGNPDLGDTIARLQAYERAGADVLYAPGLRSVEEIRAVCDAVDKPVNVLARPNLGVAEIAAAGATRISVGGALAWVAMRALEQAGRALLDGDLSVLDAPGPAF